MKNKIIFVRIEYRYNGFWNWFKNIFLCNGIEFSVFTNGKNIEELKRDMKSSLNNTILKHNKTECK